MKERRGCIRLDEEKLFWQNVDVLLVDTINYLKKLISFKSYSEEEKDIVDYIEKQYELWFLSMEMIQ